MVQDNHSRTHKNFEGTNYNNRFSFLSLNEFTKMELERLSVRNTFLGRKGFVTIVVVVNVFKHY
jgi:hypothetical protein